MQKHTFDRIPGLILYPDHFAEGQCALLLRQSVELYAGLESTIAQPTTLAKARIPQPDFARSARHNLASEEFYTTHACPDQSTDR